jgi:outer membrane protein assembly factor BamB
MRSRRTTLLGLLVASVVMLGLASSATGSGGSDWPQYRSDPARSGLSGGGSTITTANVASLTEAWTADVRYSEAVVAGGVVYANSDVAGQRGEPLAGDGKLYAFDAAGASGCSGSPKVCQPLWSTDNFAAERPVVAGGLVYASSVDPTLAAFDAAGVSGCSGSPKVCEPLWTARDGAVVSSPAVVDGVVYVASLDGSLYAYDAAGVSGCSGSPKVCEPLWTAPTRGGMASSPAVVDGVVYVIGDRELYAYDAAGVSGCSGSPKVCEPLWTASTGNPGWAISSTAVADGVVYLASYGSTLLAFDAAGASGCSGSPKVCEPLWTANLGGEQGLSSSPTVAGGVVYIGSADGNLYALDAAGASGCSGSPKVCTPLWTARIGGRIEYSTPAVVGDVVFISNDSSLHAYDAAGVSGCSGNPKVCTPLWTVNVPVSYASPSVAGGAVYVGASDGLHVYSLPTVADTTPPTIAVTTPPEGAVYVRGQVVNADYGCQDEAGGSGLASCVGTVANGTPINTATVGAKTFTVTAADNAGNTSSVTHHYSVRYSFSGFQAPVDNPPTVNTGRAGRTYPVKWQLRDANGNFISALSAVVDILVRPTSCSVFTEDPTDALEATATGGAGLRYDSSVNQYIYNWATPGRGCYTLFLRLDSGQVLPAFFNLS